MVEFNTLSNFHDINKRLNYLEINKKRRKTFYLDIHSSKVVSSDWRKRLFLVLFQMKINHLVQQLGEQGGGGGREEEKKIRSLEKELHYYKKICRDLRTASNGDQEIEIARDHSRTFNRLDEVRTERSEDEMSVVEQSHIQQFQRKLAKLQRRMEVTPKPTVTREHRKLIIENPVTPENSLDRQKTRKKKR